MPTIWTFKPWLASEHGIHTATDLGNALRQRANVNLSLQALCVLLSEPPKALRLRTAQSICNAFRCELSEFFEVQPDPPGDASRMAVALGGPQPLYRSSKRRKSDEDELLPNPALFRRLK